MTSYNPYLSYYNNQAGGAIKNVYAGASFQRGYGGLGSFFRTLWRGIVPLFTGATNSLGKELVRTAGNVVTDISSNTPWKQSLKSRIGEATNNLNEKLNSKIQSMIGDGYKRRAKKRKRQSSKRRGTKKLKRTPCKKKKSCDIFG